MPIKTFNKINKEDVAIAGGKGASLGEMTQAGIPVPEGYIILSNTFEEFIKENNLNAEIDSILDKVDTEIIHTVDEASEQIKALIINSEISKKIKKEIEDNFKKLNSRFVAVRSSATAEDSASATWAGQLDTYLNTTKKDLLENVRKCWASLFTPRAIFYRFEQKLNKQNISVAVVVQKMIESEESGIAFSVHPVTQDKNHIIIEAGLGLGEAIVSGQITPDSYVVDKQDWHIIDINVNEQKKALYGKKEGGNEWQELGDKGKKQVLSEKEIIELSKLIKKIEDHYGFPVDVEWAKEKGKFYITQSRPITTLINLEPVEKDKCNLNPDDYYFIWTFGVNYFLASIIVGSYTKRETQDYIACGDHREHSFFISKKFHKKILEKGFKTVYTEFKDYKERIKNQLKKTEEFFKKEKVKNLKEFSNIKLAKEFEKAVDYCLKIWDDYLWTEHYTLLKAEKVLVEKDLKYDLKLLQRNLKDMGKLKYEQRKLINKSYFPPSILYKYVDEANNRLKLGQKIGNYHYKELIDLLKWKEVEIPDRTYWIRGKFSNWKDITGTESKKIINRLLYIDKNLKEFDGSIGNKGYYKGVVKKIDFDMNVDFLKIDQEMKKGDVLVTSSTGPEMILACKKAGAIITDEGGIASHAAIISRELKIPSVIGTKIATRILKDGDLIEVDANEGIVRIMTKTDKEDTKISNLIPLEYWTEEAAIPFFVITDPEGCIFEDNFLCVYCDNVCTFYYINNAHKFESQQGWNYFKRKKSTREYCLEVDNLLRKIKSLEKNKISFIETMHLLREWNILYSKTEAVRLKKFENLDTEAFLRKFKKVGEARLKMRKIGESILFAKIDSAIDEIAKKNSMNSDDIFLYTFEELQELIKEQKKVSLQTIKKRSKGYIYWIKDGQSEFYTGNDFGKLFSQLKNVTIKENVTELIGKGVSKGVVKGEVQLVLHNDYDISNQVGLFKKGKILVTEMTRSQLITICHKAKGIITNEGGILSHATIVSRELNKPCVIGTKIATKVLKDGDLIEVDANKGIIKILKK